MTKRFCGFTLAEVLITLAIIGVVAAMTMPTLINNTTATQFKTAFKKAISVLSQAVVMNIALEDYDLSLSTGTSDSSLYNLFTQRTNLTELTSTELKSYSVYVATNNTVNPTSLSATKMNSVSNYVFRFNDGIIFSFPKSAEDCTEEDPCFGWVDVNGVKGPNKTAYCTATSSTDTAGNKYYSCTSEVTVNDIYPVKMYDQTITPSSAAGKAVLFGSENMSSS